MTTSKSNKFEEYVKGLLELLKEWGASFSNNEPKEERSVQINLQTNAKTMESVELGGTSNRIRSTLKNLKHKTILLIGRVLMTLCILLMIIGTTIFAYNFLILTLEKIGVDIPEEYFTYDRKTSRYDPGTYLGY